MNTPHSPPPARPRTRPGYTDQDVCNYAHHLWIQSGMNFNGDPWAEALACLEANLPRPPLRRARQSSDRRIRAAQGSGGPLESDRTLHSTRT